MFFYLSKIFWLLAAPSNLIGLCMALAALALIAGRFKTGRILAITAVCAYVIAGILPLGQILLRPLEDRFSRPQVLAGPPKGIIVLGGGIDEQMGAARGTSELSEAGGRMSEAAALAHRYPEAKIYFAGGSASLTGSKFTEAAAGRKFFVEQGINPARIILEDKSRNTRENAELVKRLAQPQPGEVWLLVTSAWHMPRSMGIFGDVQFPVIAWPADYSTHGTRRDWTRPNFEASRGLKLTDRAVKEWIGLIAYYLTGRTDALLPGPKPSL
jgi:uncharacterized SAM-binding protein YcdF (DUF218 family)